MSKVLRTYYEDMPILRLNVRGTIKLFLGFYPDIAHGLSILVRSIQE